MFKKFHLFILCYIFYTISTLICLLYSQNHLLSFESNVSHCRPRELNYNLIHDRVVKFVFIYSDYNLSDYYRYKEEDIGFELGITSQLKLLHYWNLIGKLKYGQYRFIGWHNFDTKTINTLNGEDKIFLFYLDNYRIHSIKIGMGINAHYSDRIYFQYIPMFNFPIGISKKQAIGEYALKYTSPTTTDFTKSKNSELMQKSITYGFEVEIAAKAFKNLYIFCNYSKIKDLYREKSNKEVKWGMRMYNIGLRYHIF